MIKKRLLSGIKPTGNIHLGNYFGAMKQFLTLQDQYECFLFVADYHALNQIHDPRLLQTYRDEIIKAYLSIGLNHEKIIFFRQSDISALTELTWIFNCVTPMSLLLRAHAYKDAKAKNKAVNMGLFDYPVFMAADILLVQSDIVPVGRDQKQHVEIAQVIGKKFNNLFGNTFHIPEVRFQTSTQIVPGLDGRKMSKSYHNVIALFDSEKIIRKKIMSMKTDSKRSDEPKDPEACPVFAFHRLLEHHDIQELARRYENGTISYQESKEMLVDEMISFLAPIWKKKAYWDNHPREIEQILQRGSDRVQTIAHETVLNVRKKIGISV